MEKSSNLLSENNETSDSDLRIDSFSLRTREELAAVCMKLISADDSDDSHDINSEETDYHLDHIIKVISTLELFFPKGTERQMPEIFYKVASLLPIVDNINSETQGFECKKALKDYLEGPNLSREELENLDLIVCLLANRFALNENWQNQIDKMREQNESLSLTLGRQDDELGEAWQQKAQENEAFLYSSQLSDDEVIPEKTWEIKPIAIYSSEINEMIRELEIESIALAAAGTLTELRKGGNSANLLRNVFQAESFLAPVLEIIAENKDVEKNNKQLSDFAMVLNSAAKCVRLENAGEGRFIEMAKNVLARNGNHNAVVDSVATAIEAVTDTKIDHDKIKTDYDKNNHIVSFSGHAMFNDTILYFFGRRKSLGSLAEKMMKAYKKHEEDFNKGKISEEEFSEKTKLENLEPMDFVALTFVPLIESDQSKHQIFAEMAKNAQNDERIFFKPSDSRQESLHVRGDEKYRDNAARELIEQGFSLENSAEDYGGIEQKSDERGMNLSKMTFTYDDPENNLPPLKIELQHLTRKVRAIMILGLASHLAYKLEVETKDKKFFKGLTELNKRGSEMCNGEIFNENSSAIKRFLEKIDSSDLFVKMMTEDY